MRGERQTEYRYVEDVLMLLRESIAEHGGQKPWARAHGLSHGYLWRVLNGTTKPGPALLKLLGLRKVTRYVEDVE